MRSGGGQSSKPIKHAIGVSLGLVRRASARGAYLLAAAAGVRLLSTCCMRATALAARGQDISYQALDAGLTCLDLLASLAMIGLISYAFVTLAGALRGPSSGSPRG